MLLFRTGRFRCAIPMRCVREILRPLPLERLAGAPPAVAGLAVLRGAPTPVVNLGALLGIQDPAPDRRWVSLRVEDRVVALAVQEVEGVREVDDRDAGELPPLLSQALPEAVERLGALDRQFLAVLGALRLVPDGTGSFIPQAEGGR